MNSRKYIPPYKVSGRAMNLIAEIAAAVENIELSANEIGAVEERFLALKALAREHGCAIDDLPDVLEDILETKADKADKADKEERVKEAHRNWDTNERNNLCITEVREGKKRVKEQ